FSKPEHEMDLTERWIRRFALQNRQWSTCWYDRYLEIERHMFDFQISALQGDRASAIKAHAQWIEAQANDDPDDHIPYRQEAALFANIYWSNRRRYEAEFASAKTAE
ncbi:MAG: hypothetical protein V7632_2249, partial [Bradyrhizobium sp.]